MGQYKDGVAFEMRRFFIPEREGFCRAMVIVPQVSDSDYGHFLPLDHYFFASVY